MSFFKIRLFYSLYHMTRALTVAFPIASVSSLLMPGRRPPDSAESGHTHECSIPNRNCNAHHGGMLRSELARVSSCRLVVAQLKLINRDVEQRPAASQRARSTKWLHHPERTLREATHGEHHVSML